MARRVLFSDLADEVLEEIRLRCRPRTYDVAIAPIRYLKETFRGVLAKNVLPDDFYSMHVPRMNRIKPGLNLNTQRKHFIQILFRAYRQGLIKTPPLKIPKPSKPKDVGRELTDDEIVRIFKACKSQDLKFQIKIALLTGMRLREILHLKWESLDLKSCTMFLPCDSTKTGKSRFFPFSFDLFPEFERRSKKSHPVYVFPMPSDLNRPQNDIGHLWERTLKRAGVKCRFHDLRHTAATRKIRAGNSLVIVSREMGMRVEVLEKIYTHLNVEDLRKSADSVRLPVVA
jgi:integrase